MRRMGCAVALLLAVQCAPASRSEGFLCTTHDDCEAGRTCEQGWCVEVAAGDVVTGDPSTGDPSTGDPNTGDPNTGDPPTGDPLTGDPLGDPLTGDPLGDPLPGDPMGDPLTGDPAGDPIQGDPLLADGFYCLPSGHGQLVRAGTPIDAGPCVLGCDASADACRVPSNVPAGWMSDVAGDLDLTAATTVTIDSDTGEIVVNGSTLRAGGIGVDSGTGIGFENATQSDDSTVGVLVLGAVAVPDGATVTVTGTQPLVLLASDAVAIAGIIDVGAAGQEPGPGGFPGGDATLAGGGDCGGVVGEGTNECTALCGTGSSGAGHGTVGGDGGPVESYTGTISTEPLTLTTPLGGGICGDDRLIPLAGGSGGAGADINVDHDYGAGEGPGPGGGGGGAIQITSAIAIDIAATGVITAPGGGGAESISSPGAGGGAGGAILLEAPTITLTSAGVLAANGGGGGGGDCT